MRDFGDYERVPGLQAAHRRPSCGPSASTSAWPSRTTAATYDMFHAEGVPCVYIHSGYYD